MENVKNYEEIIIPTLPTKQKHPSPHKNTSGQTTKTQRTNTSNNGENKNMCAKQQKHTENKQTCS